MLDLIVRCTAFVLDHVVHNDTLRISHDPEFKAPTKIEIRRRLVDFFLYRIERGPIDLRKSLHKVLCEAECQLRISDIGNSDLLRLDIMELWRHLFLADVALLIISLIARLN